MDARCKKGVFVGYDKNSPAYLVYHSDTNDVRRCRCVKFTDIKPEFEVPADEYDDFEIHKTPDPVTVPQGDDIPSVSNNDENTEAEDVVRDDVPVDDIRIHSRYPKRRCELPKYLRDYDLHDSTKCNIDYCCRLSAIP